MKKTKKIMNGVIMEKRWWKQERKMAGKEKWPEKENGGKRKMTGKRKYKMAEVRNVVDLH